MRFTELCLKKPVFAIVLNLFVLMLGVLSFFKLETREYPPFEAPVLSIETRYRGASVEIVEGQVTRPIEKNMAELADLDYITSYSRFEESWVELHFKSHANLDEAVSAMRGELNKIQNMLPKNANAPEIIRSAKDTSPLLSFALSSDEISPFEISHYAQKFLKPRLKSIDGVGNVKTDGVKSVIRITLDPIILAAHQLTVKDVVDAFEKIQDFSGGVRQIGGERIDITATAKFSSIEKLNKLILKRENKGLLMLRDVGNIVYGPDLQSSVSKYNGNPTTIINLVKTPAANPVNVARAVMKELPLIQEGLPEGLHLKLLYNGADFIEASIDSVTATIFEALVLVGIVIFFFLRRFKLTLVPMIAIPFSLVSALILIYGFGYSINRLTLLAFVLAIGLVVDDAIVVLENIYRKAEEGLTPFEAARKGIREMSFSVLAMTLTLAVVFIPLIFARGMTGQLFQEFAIALSGAVLFSGFTALTLSPLLTRSILKTEKSMPHQAIAYEGLYFKKLKGFLQKSVSFVLVASFAVIGIGAGSYWYLQKEMIPQEDRGVIKIGAATRSSVTKDYFERHTKPIENILAEYEDVQDFFSITYNNYFDGNAVLKPFSERDSSSREIIKKLGKTLDELPGVWSWAYEDSPLKSQDPSMLEFVIQSKAHRKQLPDFGRKMMRKLRKTGLFKYVNLDAGSEKSLFKFKLNREKIAELDIDMDAIKYALEAAQGGYRGLTFETNDNDYQVMLQTTDAENFSGVLSSHYVKANHSEDAAMVPLSGLLEESLTSGPNYTFHFNGIPAIKVQAHLESHVTMDEGMRTILKTARNVLPKNIQTDFAGGARQMDQNTDAFFMLFGLGVLFIYLILAAQFESFIDPLIILVSVPLAATGGLLLLALFGQTLNVYSQIGLVTLIGLITKHGILLVDFANKARAAGKDIEASIMEAVQLRLRPILMTTGAMVMGAIPLVISTGVGAESYVSIGLVLLGGLILGTLLTLFFVPYVYVKVKALRA